ncbi:MAG TPA: 2-oxoglutarate dehydrogenase complex dihydrolipoyllysine-residue succinyltransferase [Candidatus Krumholzibacteria bacterium]|nr:2-oxoglutarate dehydrogenase complex dihydrolipoyllysine-residue succinyltransferase [Candidatus Krumholzibacteria bacterium]HPD71843.1 2-oxoglutarate dehydrogenase complex dihydrolipoyllysine-residue succinyltransferase [Candidatus Krumholzibacteria bacterium]HRY41224.1 2-oxoglutarate dehydrogenase complex dihydrolipoyllysine-residue succinyltransferase [Candidatus Krumholzibacteria bacterium]
MAVEVRIPELGESISEVQVADWIRRLGEVVAADEPLAEIDSDKATVELPAPVAGRLVEIRVPAGTYCKVGDVVALIDETASGEPGGPAAPRASATPATGQAPTGPAATDATVMPAARRVLAEQGLSAAQVTGTGPGGRVLKEDALRATAATPPPPAPRPAAGSREERLRPMSPIRRRIADRLVAAQNSAALLTTFNEVDMSAVKAMRARHQEAFQARYGVKLGFMSFFTKAVIDALRLVPQLNSEIRGQDIVERDYYDIGIAIGSGKGLVVPVIRNAEALGFGDLEQRIADFAGRAQNKKIDLAELEGGTFTISNGGVYGSLLSTPIVNPPQSGVLGLHAIQDRAVVVGGEIVVRPMMYVALTYDHRIVDGREGVTFLKHVKECIEAPERLMLEV